MSSKIEVSQNGKTVITLDGSQSSVANISAGDNGTLGFLSLMDKDGTEIVSLGRYEHASGGETPEEPLHTETFNGLKINLPQGTEAAIISGNEESGANVTFCDKLGQNVFRFNSDNAELVIGTNNNAGNLRVHDKEGRKALRFHGENASLIIGDKGKAGSLSTFNDDGSTNIVLATGGNMFINGTQLKPIFEFRRENSTLFIGGEGSQGIISLRDNLAKKIITIDAASRKISLKDSDDKEIITIDAASRKISLKDSDDKEIITIDAASRKISLKDSDDKEIITMGGNERKIRVWNAQAKESISIDGNSGDILFMNADCAEEFNVSSLDNAEPGTVMVLSNDSQLMPSYKAYDKKVAGVISGAGNCKPGIVLDKKTTETNRVPIALVGKVYCKVDTKYSQICIGDILTTSPTIGHAMKVTNYSEAFGAVLGKALSPLKQGTGLIPILVTLQ